MSYETVKTGDMSCAETEYRYDSLDRISSVTMYNDAFDDFETNTTQYFYDLKGNPVKVITGLEYECSPNYIPETAAVTEYEYDPYYNSITRIKKPDGTNQYFDYSATGRLTSQFTVGNDVATEDIFYEYDLLGQLTYKTSDNLYENYSYDNLGRLTQVSDSSGVTNFTYDILGRVTSETSNNGVVKNYGYDKNGNRTSFDFYTGETLQQSLDYVYDRLNRVTEIKESNTTVSTYMYDENSNLLTENKCGFYTDYWYNDGNMLVEKITDNLDSYSLNSDYITRNPDGNVSALNDKAYNYNDFNQLVSVGSPFNSNITSSYTFDDFNNRVTLTGTEGNSSYTYNKNNQILTAVQGDFTTSYSYDVRGNLTSEVRMDTAYDVLLDDIDYTYDDFGRLTNYYDIISDVDYTYNYEGLRTSKTVDGVTTQFVLDGGSVIAEVTNGQVTNYVRGVNGIIYRKAPDGTKTYYVTNHHGDVVKLVNSSGVVIKSYEYDEYGNELDLDYDDTNPFRYCGEYFDTESGLIYLRARYYDPTIGRFISEDTHWTPQNMIYGDNQNNEVRDNDKDKEDVPSFELPDMNSILQSSNLYVYCINNPINYFDIEGESVSVASVGISAGFIFGVDAQILYVWDDKGNCAYISSTGWTVSTGGGISASIGVMIFPDMTTIEAFVNGDSVSFGGSVNGCGGGVTVVRYEGVEYAGVYANYGTGLEAEVQGEISSENCGITNVVIWINNEELIR